jgi:hypothetical protein
MEHEQAFRDHHRRGARPRDDGSCAVTERTVVLIDDGAIDHDDEAVHIDDSTGHIAVGARRNSTQRNVRAVHAARCQHDNDTEPGPGAVNQRHGTEPAIAAGQSFGRTVRADNAATGNQPGADTCPE